MSILNSFITSYKEQFKKDSPIFDESLLELIQKTQHVLLDEKMLASKELKDKLLYLHARAKEPMKVAITGQFSSGKSTFLNALLSKNILPTGITPVTSKVNYIKYGDELKIKINYKDKREEFQSVEHIAKFTDQRDRVEEVEYLTLYAPLPLLKEIIFIDTPGLNSQTIEDTKETQKVLKEVDGIIWLSLIDNAGKLSEIEVLEEYLNEYKNKSLCVLNQKDKFSKEQITKTTCYVKKSFIKFFSEVIPISAKQALESRTHDKNLLIDEELEEFLTKLSQEIKTGKLIDIKSLYENYQKNVNSISNSDLNRNIELLKESNIELVLEFINTQIRPIANISKEFAIKKDITFICNSLIKEHEFFLKIYRELTEQLSSFEKEADEKFSELKIRFTKKLKDAYSRIEEIIDTVSHDIYNHIETLPKVRFMKKKSSFFKDKNSYEAVEYKSSKIDADSIYKHLFYDDNIIGKMFKKYVKNLKEIQDEVNENSALVYNLLKKKMRKWQNSYEFIEKLEDIHSDIESANMRKFASKVYENILKPFSDEMHSSYAQISSEFNHLSSAVSFNYQNAAQVCVSFLEKKIEQSIELYEENPTKFTLYRPKLEEIKERLNISFYLYKLSNLMNTNNTFLNKNYDKLIKEFRIINKDRKFFIKKIEERHQKTIEIYESLLKI
ncbi:MAG: dynamin family protein [Sulfurospirillum sp.]|nr:dynamin family protein [Sulfurospirillum sp.]